MLKPREQKLMPGFGCAAVLILNKLFLFIVERNISLAQDRWHSVLYPGKKLTMTHEKFIFTFPGASRLQKLSWKISAPLQMWVLLKYYLRYKLPSVHSLHFL